MGISKGVLDYVSTEELNGWAVIEGYNADPEILITVDGKEAFRAAACLFREDVLKEGLHQTGHCGFNIKVFDHSILEQGKVVRVFVEQTGVELEGSPYYLQGRMSQILSVETNPIIFIHIPKTAGTSFNTAASTVFRPSEIIADYGQDAFETSDLIKNTVYAAKGELLVDEMIERQTRFFTGHFPALKYLNLFDNHVRWCTFLRNPIQRVISEYFHLVNNFDYKESLEDYCSYLDNCNKQSKLLSGLKLEEMYFIGITELYKESVFRFNCLSSLHFPVLTKNTHRQNLNEIYTVDAELLKLVTENNADDVILYEKVRAGFT